VGITLVNTFCTFTNAGLTKSCECKVITSHIVGRVSCLVVLCPKTARRESRCPLYRAMLFCALSPHKLNYWLHYKSVSLQVSLISLQTQLLTSSQKCYWLHYKLNYLLHYKSVTDFITNSITYFITKMLLTLLQTQLLTSLQKCYWLHYKLLSTFYWPHYKLSTYFITNCYWPTSIQRILTHYKLFIYVQTMY
jgi:hypothetical protein